MKKRYFTRRDFLKLTGLGTAVIVPASLGISLYHSALGEYPAERSPYVEIIHTASLDGSVPILLIVNRNSPNPFGIYLGEILRAEGLNCFHTVDLSDIKSEALEKYKIVLLAETPVDAAQAEIFEGYVWSGGRLIGIKPDDRLAAMFGVERIDGEISEGYIKTEVGDPICKGINPSPMQFHGSASLYRSAGAKIVAWLISNRESASENPAITVNSRGRGIAALWSFDLAKSIAYTRQGNPKFAGQERDGHPFIRAADMFAEWLDLDGIAIPQADEQQRLFTNLIYGLSRDRIPLPRLWYLPGDVNALLVATGDAHPFSGGEAINEVLTKVEQRGGHMSIYYSFTLHDDFYRSAQRARFYADKLPAARNWLRSHYKTPSPDQVHDWRARGHEFTLHPHVGTGTCGGISDGGMVQFDHLEDGWQAYWQQFTGLGYGPVSPTVRTHCVLWSGWTETARLQASYGIRMNLDYYHVGPAFRKKNGDRVYGYMTGSGLPMKFIDEKGRLLDIYQQLTQLADEHFFYFPEINTIHVSNYTAEEALVISRGLMQSALNNSFPTAFALQFHADPFAYGGRPAAMAGRWMEGTLDYAVENGIPIWSAQEWLRFTRARHDANVVVSDWNEDGLVLNVVVESGLESVNGFGGELVLMIPAEIQNAHLSSIKIDGTTATPGERKVGDIQYYWIPISAGIHKVAAHYSQ